ncbi:tRNA (adenine(58)-N(1))-methyltransferase non-catalytic subunit trm6 [Irineochytrium annulatum]|nr:tRNA (adenine(58)-N(1))-methyltransferase non-catalytic subunit trm6 [Irineochytrium annulatum]
MKQMNLPEAVQATCHALPFSKLDEEEEFKSVDCESKEKDKFSDKKEARLGRIRQCKEMLKEGQFDGLVIASVCKPDEIVMKLKDYLGGSRPIIIYAPFKEMLIPLYITMRATAEFINTQLTESFMREYQAPTGMGTHPNMQTSGSGGFILSTIKVLPHPEGGRKRAKKG